MEHKIIQGGEQFLPFARSRIKALRATGLRYANQQFEVDGISIKVRIEGENEFIRIEGGAAGAYLVTPNNTADPTGDTEGGTKTPDAELVFSVGPKVGIIKHSPKLAGATDWKNWKTGKKARTLSYNSGFTMRYQPVLNTGITGNFNLFYKNRSVVTPSKVIGAGIFSAVVDDVTIERFVYLERFSDQSVRVYYSKIQDAPSWSLAGTYSWAGLTVTSSLGGVYGVSTNHPWYFGPDGDKFASLLSDSSGSTTEKLVIRGQLTAAYDTGTSEYVLTAAFAVGEKVGKDYSVVQNNPVSVSFSYTPGVTDVSPETFVNCGVNDRSASPYSGTKTFYETTIGSEDAIGVDYLPNGTEVIVSVVTTANQKAAPIYGGGTSFVSTSAPTLTVMTMTATQTSMETYSQQYFAGGTLMFGVNSVNSSTQSSTYEYRALGFVLTAPPTPTPAIEYAGLVVHAIDARDSSGVIEYFQEGRAGGTYGGFYPFTPGGADSVGVPSTFSVKSGVKTYYKGVLAKDSVVYDIPSSGEFFGYSAFSVANPHNWTHASKFAGVITNATMASARDGEFVSSVRMPLLLFHDVVQNSIGAAGYTTLKTAYSATPHYSADLFKTAFAGPAQLAKIPYFGTPGFNIHRVRLL